MPHPVTPATTRALIALATTALLLLPLTATPPPAQAEQAASEITLQTTPEPGNPLEVAAYTGTDPPAPEDCVAESGDRYDDACYQVGLSIGGVDEVSDVEVTVVERRGLYVDPVRLNLGDLAGTSRFVRFAVRARTPGLHTLTLEVTAPGAEPERVSLPYVWREGGAPLTGDDSLAGRTYGVSGLDSYPCAPNGDCRYRYARRLSFLDDTRVSRALAERGRAGCGSERPCTTYRYDAASGLVQVGAGTIGRVTDEGAFFGGVAYQRLVYPRPGRRLDGRWLYGADVDEGRGVVEQLLVLRGDGRFRLRHSVDTLRYPRQPTTRTTYGRRMSGTYRIGRLGRLRLDDNRRRLTEVATLAVAATPSGAPRAATEGVWLDVSVDPSPRGRRFIDGNLLTPLG